MEVSGEQVRTQKGCSGQSQTCTVPLPLHIDLTGHGKPSPAQVLRSCLGSQGWKGPLGTLSSAACCCSPAGASLGPI